jgi:hypothetical protein
MLLWIISGKKHYSYHTPSYGRNAELEGVKTLGATRVLRKVEFRLIENMHRAERSKDYPHKVESENPCSNQTHQYWRKI